MIQPAIAKYMKTAKVGTWKKLGETIKTLSKLYLTTGGASYFCDFSSKDEGAFFIIAEGMSVGYELLLVLPDALMSTFLQIESMTVPAAYETLANLNIGHGTYSGLDEFCEWFDDKWDSLGGYADNVQVSVLGNQLQFVPQYSNPNHSISTFFEWIYELATAAGISTYMSDTLASDREYDFPITITGGGVSATLTAKLSI